MSSPVEQILSGLPARLNCTVLSRPAGSEGGAGFELLAEAPWWFEEVFGGVADVMDRSPFLADFVEHRAADHWAGGTSSVLESGFWEERNDCFFEAHVWTSAAGEQILLLLSVDEVAKNRRLMVQRNHEQELDRRRMLKEIEKKEILLDCIVHDLSGPVGTLIMNIEHISRTLGQASTLQPAVERAMNQAQRQLTMIRSISHLFTSDLQGPADAGKNEQSAAGGVDVVAVVHEMTDLHRPANGSCRMQFKVVRPDIREVLRARGREAHVSRVVENLLLNAVRYVPSTDGEVLVTVEALGVEDGRQIEIRVEDNGPGVEPGLAAELFQPFSQGKNQPGQSGLGLYFCRIAVEQYGGTIGYRDRVPAANGEEGAKGGACFWFRLPREEAGT